jgi:hypothetical protein
MLNISPDMLTDIAFSKLIKNLKQYGNNPSPKHQKALRMILRTYSDMATGNLTGRWAFPLFTGGGKTQSIVAWLWAIYKTEQADNVSVSVCASRVEALCELKRNLMGVGIPEEKIALVHSYRYDGGRYKTQGDDTISPGYASEPATPPDLVDSRPILLLTHNRVKGKGGIEQFMEFQSKSRTLMIWDESLLQSESRGIREDLLRSAIGWYEPKVKRWDTTTEKAFDYVKECLHILDQEKDRQKLEPKTDALILSLPRLTAEQVTAYKEVFPTNDITATVRDLLEISQNALRAVDTSQGGGLLQYEIVVPKELENIVILDASVQVRDLCQMDRTIVDMSKAPPYQYPENIVTYENVKVQQLKHAGGRGSIFKALTSKKRGKTPLLQEIVEYVKGLPETDGILFFTFKKRYDPATKKSINPEDILKKALEAEGIDPKATLKNGKHRFQWLTHGNETSLSKYSYCKHQIWVGVLYRGLVELGSQIAGQRDDLRTEIPLAELHSTCLSEIVYCYHQGFGRGPCRVVNADGTVGEQTVLIVFNHPSYDVEAKLKTVMPGIRWTLYDAKYVNTQTKVQKLAHKIAAYLKDLERSGDVRKVSTQKVKESLGLKDIPRMTAIRAMKEVPKTSQNWTLEGRSFVLMDARYWGFNEIATD